MRRASARSAVVGPSGRTPCAHAMAGTSTMQASFQILIRERREASAMPRPPDLPRPVFMLILSPMRKASALLVIAVSLALAAAPAEARKRAKRRGKAPAPVAAVTRDGWPNVMSAAAVIVDLDKGEEIYAKNADDQRFIASVGKLFVALVVRDKGLPLDGKTTITEEDKDLSRGGARSRLLVGKTFTNHDLLRAMLIASDNRAVTAVARGAGLGPKELVEALNAKA